MKSQVLTGIGQMEMAEVETPRIVKDTDVLIKIGVVGVCGSDVHYFETGRIGSQVVQYPYRVGHECAGTVAEVGKAVDNVKVGETVVVEPAIACHKCDQCLSGREHTCRELLFLACPGQVEGCLGEYLVMPQECCFGIDGKLTLEQGALCEPFAIGVYAVKQAMLSAGDSVAILGCGPIGLSCLVAAKAGGVKDFYVTDKIDARLDVAHEQGAVWAGNVDTQDVVAGIYEKQPGGMDVVFECCGEQDAIDNALELLKPGGKLILIGIPRVDSLGFSPDLMRRKEITVINIRRQNECTQAAINMLASGRANIDFMVTHRYGFDDSKAAFDLVAGYEDGVVKAMIEFGS
jgi:L-iditol 2-dehydrogenase